MATWVIPAPLDDSPVDPKLRALLDSITASVDWDGMRGPELSAENRIELATAILQRRPAQMEAPPADPYEPDIIDALGENPASGPTSLPITMALVQPEKPNRSRSSKSEREARAIALLVQHPDWTNVQIATQLPISPGQLSRWPKYKAARKAQKAPRKLPHGSKVDGQIEAVDDD